MGGKRGSSAGAGRATGVADYLRRLEHARKDEVEAVRRLVLAAHAGLTEHVKWNAPSFCLGGEDRITFRLHPGDRVQLVFHRGAKARDAGAFRFEDRSGLLEWAAADRGVVTFAGLADVRAKAARLRLLVNAWLEATG